LKRFFQNLFLSTIEDAMFQAAQSGSPSIVLKKEFLMKTARIMSLVFALSTLFAGAAHAVVNMGDWERPISQAQMNIIEAQASMANVRHVELITTERDGAIAPTGFVLLIDGRPMTFEVSRAQEHPCGDVLYVGLSVSSSVIDTTGHLIRLAVVDHSHTSCDGKAGNVHSLPVGFPLEAVLMDGNHPLLELAGKPEPLVSPL
jgi:hypothetical protein